MSNSIQFNSIQFHPIQFNVFIVIAQQYNKIVCPLWLIHIKTATDYAHKTTYTQKREYKKMAVIKLV